MVRQSRRRQLAKCGTETRKTASRYTWPELEPVYRLCGFSGENCHSRKVSNLPEAALFA